MSRIRRRQFLILASALLCAPLSAAAQPAKKTWRVGVLIVAPMFATVFPRRFPDALRALGYVEGQNLILEWRLADGRRERLADLAADLVRIKVDVIVTVTTPDALAARKATATIPIVMVASQDPVGAGLVASMARPGGNVTGRTWSSPETSGKQLQILKEAFPAIRRVVNVGAAGLPGLEVYLKSAQAAARALGLSLRVLELSPTDDVARILEEIDRAQPDALFVSAGGISAGQQNAILKFAVRHRLPTMSSTRGVVAAGALMGYGPSALEAVERTAWYVDRILKGARPADLPVEQPLRYDLVINMKTARASGLTIAPSVLLQATELIE